MPHTPDDSNRRERLRAEYLIAQRWRRQGIAWTAAQLADAANAEMKERPSAKPPRVVSQPELFDTGQNAKETRALAAKASQAGTVRRRDAILQFVIRCGWHGATRIEISRGIDAEINFVTRPVLDLIEAGELVETARRRKTPSGCTAAVIVARAYANAEAHP